MWTWVKDRLDRRWKRVAFIFWAPLFVVTALISMYALLHVYKVYVSSYVFVCHRDFAGFVRNDNPFDPQNDRALHIAHERSDSRFSSDTRQVESTPEFIQCMSKDFDNGIYWMNYSYIMSIVEIFILSTAVFALIIFPRFWRLMGHAIGDWNTMKT